MTSPFTSQPSLKESHGGSLWLQESQPDHSAYETPFGCLLVAEKSQEDDDDFLDSLNTIERRESGVIAEWEGRDRGWEPTTQSPACSWEYSDDRPMLLEINESGVSTRDTEKTSPWISSFSSSLQKLYEWKTYLKGVVAGVALTKLLPGIPRIVTEIIPLASEIAVDKWINSLRGTRQALAAVTSVACDIRKEEVMEMATEAVRQVMKSGAEVVKADAATDAVIANALASSSSYLSSAASSHGGPLALLKAIWP